MKQAGIKKRSTSVAHIPDNEVECPSLRYQFGHCFGGSTNNNIAAVTVDKSAPAAAANRAILTQLLPSNSGGRVSIVTDPNNTDTLNSEAQYLRSPQMGQFRSPRRGSRGPSYATADPPIPDAVPAAARMVGVCQERKHSALLGYFGVRHCQQCKWCLEAR